MAKRTPRKDQNGPSKHVIRPSEAWSWNECLRKAWMNANPPPANQLAEPGEMDKFLWRKGDEHEERVLKKLAEEFTVETATSPAHTQQLMKQGVDIIYQAELVDKKNNIVGHPDFLIKQDDGTYAPADAKLANDPEKKNIQIQLGLYRKMMDTKNKATVFLGNGDTEEIGDEVNDKVEEFVSSMKNLLGQKEMPDATYSRSKCGGCRYRNVCTAKFEQQDELTLVYGVTSKVAEAMKGVGINTITELAKADPAQMPEAPYLKTFERRERFVEQAKSRQTGSITQTGEVELPKGTWIHFDIEANPVTESGEDHVYLWGFIGPPYNRKDYKYVWTDTDKDDKKGWMKFLKMAEEYRKKHSDVIFAHYSQYEVSAIKRYAKRYEMEDNDTVKWLLDTENGPMYDMYKPVKQNLVLPVKGYGLKDICQHPGLVNFQWGHKKAKGDWSVVEFHEFLEEEDPIRKAERKASLLSYNCDDVVATRKLEEWLNENFVGQEPGPKGFAAEPEEEAEEAPEKPKRGKKGGPKPK